MAALLPRNSQASQPKHIALFVCVVLLCGGSNPNAEVVLPRVLIIGDSISIGYTPPLAKMLEGRVIVEHNAGNAGPSSHGVENIEAWLGTGKWDLIHFNHGLHDIKYVDESAKNVNAKENGERQVSPDQYRKNLESIVERLEKTGAKLVFATTTPVPEHVKGPYREPGDVEQYNAIACHVMNVHRVPINDLYAFVLPRLNELQKPFDVHYTEQGSAVLAERVGSNIADALGIAREASGSEALEPEKSQANARENPNQSRRPNILFAIADDWSWPHASIAGTKGVSTPNFDRVAREGVLLTRAFCAAPQCSPNRAALLTGRHIWQLEEAGTHSSLFPNKFKVFPDQLEGAGYHVGFTGKGWDPGNWREGGWARNPAGPEFRSAKFADVPTSGIDKNDYAGNFDAFLDKRPEGAPFCFWYGGLEPHRKYEKGSGLKSGKRLEDVAVPSFLPDNAEVRSDMLDYFLEIEWFDAQLGKMLHKLEALGELDNTIVVVTGDNGMSFPRAKANLYEYGVHVPLAIRWGGQVAPGRTNDDLISFVDLAPTLLDATLGTVPIEMAGKSFLGLLTSGAAGPNAFVVFGRERHSHARHDNLGYPARAIRTSNYLYIQNLKQDRWPAGDPETYYDIDNGPSKTATTDLREGNEALFQLAVGKRPQEELYAVVESMDCMENLADVTALRETKESLRQTLEKTLTEQGDPRALERGDVFESYPRFGEMRPELGGFAKQGAYNPQHQEPKLP